MRTIGENVLQVAADRGVDKRVDAVQQVVGAAKAADARRVEVNELAGETAEQFSAKLPKLMKESGCPQQIQATNEGVLQDKSEETVKVATTPAPTAAQPSKALPNSSAIPAIANAITLPPAAPKEASAAPAAASNDEQKSTAPKSAAQGSATSPATGAPTVHAEDTCSGGWKSVAAKIPGSKVALTLSPTKEGQERLQWPNPKGEVVTVQVTKAQAPVNAQGKIVVCTTGGSIGLFGDSISLRDLAKNPQAGYYAVQVTIGGQVDPVQIPGHTSDWITIQIKEADTKKTEGGKF